MTLISLVSHTAQGGPAAPRPAPSSVLLTGSENGNGGPCARGPLGGILTPEGLYPSFPRLRRSLLYLNQSLSGSPSYYLTTIFPAERSALPPEVSLVRYNDSVSSLLSIIHPSQPGAPSPTHMWSFLGKDMSCVLHPQSLPFSRLTQLKKEWINPSINGS